MTHLESAHYILSGIDYPSVAIEKQLRIKCSEQIDRVSIISQNGPLLFYSGIKWKLN